MEVKKIDILSLAKVQGLVMAAIGLLMGLFFASLGTAMSSMMGSSQGFGFAAVIFMPIMYGIFGFVGGAIGAFIYNLVAGWIGGIKLELKK